MPPYLGLDVSICVVTHSGKLHKRQSYNVACAVWGGVKVQNFSLIPDTILVLEVID